MRFVGRLSLSPEADRGLRSYQEQINIKMQNGNFSATKEWNAKRKSGAVKAAFRTLQMMAGETERCMYCQDSHGTDIEHYKPKTPFPESMFQWENLLFCCTECGRLKGDRFPTDEDGRALFLDPSRQNPWDYIDYDPTTGNMTARFLVEPGQFSKEGETTVALLHLSRRGALAAFYKRSDKRLRELADASLSSAEDDGSIAKHLIMNDDAGLLGWYILGSGKQEEPFFGIGRTRPGIINSLKSILENPDAR